jgi:hypothetical protein
MRIRVHGSRRRTLWILVVCILPTPPTAVREGVSEGKQLLLLVYLSYTARPSPSDTEQRRSLRSAQELTDPEEEGYETFLARFLVRFSDVDDVEIGRVSGREHPLYKTQRRLPL